jgi:DNA invertase Pin-like site-specific DNA recombinase
MIMERIKEAEAGFRSLTEAIDTTTAPGRMMMQMVGAFAEFERAILRERTKTGLDAARKQGRIGGRRPKLRPDQQNEIVMMVSKGTKTGADAARIFNVHPATVSRILARAGAGTIISSFHPVQRGHDPASPLAATKILRRLTGPTSL